MHQKTQDNIGLLLFFGKSYLMFLQRKHDHYRKYRSGKTRVRYFLSSNNNYEADIFTINCIPFQFYYDGLNPDSIASVDWEKIQFKSIIFFVFKIRFQSFCIMTPVFFTSKNLIFCKFLVKIRYITIISDVNLVITYRISFFS